MNVVYVHRSFYLNILSGALGSSPSQPVFFFAWDLDIVRFRYHLVRLDTSTVFYDLPKSHPIARALTDPGGRLSMTTTTGTAVWPGCDRPSFEVRDNHAVAHFMGPVKFKIGSQVRLIYPLLGPLCRKIRAVTIPSATN